MNGIVITSKIFHIIIDIMCIILLLFLPNFILEKTGLYDSINEIIKRRKENEDNTNEYCS